MDTTHRSHAPIQYAPIPRTTSGTPCAKSWNDSWIAYVESVELALGRRICGARLVSGKPCEIESDHDSGRCRHHGGFALTGAPKGNRNAEIHALYSRRLRLCNQECPLWKQCPCASPAVAKLEPASRPTCPYEQAEYDAALEEALELAAQNSQPNPMAGHIAHNIAIIQVLLNRAALALRNAPLTVSTLSSNSVNPHTGAYVIETKPSAQLTAFVRIASEYRRFAALLLPGKGPKAGSAKNAARLLKLGESDKSDRSDKSDGADGPDRSDKSDKTEETSKAEPRVARTAGSDVPSRAEFLRPSTRVEFFSS